MEITVLELFSKDVIDISDGARVGMITDVAFDSESGMLRRVVISPASGLSLKPPPVFDALWEDIQVIGKQTVLVKSTQEKHEQGGKQKSLLKIFSR